MGISQKRYTVIIPLLALFLSVSEYIFASKNTANNSNAKLNEAFIVFSGYLTCNFYRSPENSIMFNAAERMFEDLKRSVPEIHYFTGCFKSKRESVFIRDSEMQKSTVKIPIPEVMNYVQEWLESKPDTNLNLIGSSYGGWMIVYILQNLIKSRNVKKIRVFTLDPISHERCTPREFIESIFSKDGGPSPCQQYPKGWDHLTGLTYDHWTNYYQLDFHPLHSSPIDFIEKNVFIDYKTPIINQWGHVRIQTDKAVWGHILKEITDTRD